VIGQSYVITFFADEEHIRLEIHHCLKGHYEDSMISHSEVYRWITDIQGGEWTSKRFQVQEGRETKDLAR
jgi:hypothetical protein